MRLIDREKLKVNFRKKICTNVETKLENSYLTKSRKRLTIQANMADTENVNLRAYVLPGQHGSPTKGEVVALFHIVCGEKIPDDVREAILSVKGARREIIEVAVNEWNQLAQMEIPRDQIAQMGLHIHMNLFISEISERGVGLIESNLIDVSLRSALLKEIAQNIDKLPV